MNCPVCGESIMNGKSKCLKCGYEYKSLILSQQKEQNNNKEHDDDTIYKEINPDDIHMGQQHNRGGGSILDELFGGSIFGASSFSGGIFGGFSSIIDDIFGGLFGVTEQEDDDDYDGENHYVDAFGNPIPIDVFNQDFVEIDEIEEYDADGNLKTPKKQEKKGFFNRRKKDNK